MIKRDNNRNKLKQFLKNSGFVFVNNSYTLAAYKGYYLCKFAQETNCHVTAILIWNRVLNEGVIRLSAKDHYLCA